MRLMFVAAAALALCGPAVAHPGHAPVVAATVTSPERIDLPASKGRKLPVTIWPGDRISPHPETQPVVIFLHGLGGSPEAYRSLIEEWAQEGYTVVAPIEPDSHSNADYAKVDLPAGFAMRTEDLMIARGFVAVRFPKAGKVFLAGHSYGSLFAMMGGGAVSAAGPLVGPPVAGVVAFSTPGKIPGVVLPTTFASLKVPMLLITGTNDTVPGFVRNASDHRFAFDTAAPGGKTLVTFKGAGHNLVASPGEERDMAMYLSLAFMQTLESGDSSGVDEFNALQSTPEFTVEHR